MKYPLLPQTIGILGGGQLARMMALRAHELGISPYVLSLSPNDPAAQVTSNWQQGNPDNPKDLQEFLKKVSVATVESEFFNSELLATGAKKSRIKIFPQPHLLGVLQDRLSQKNILTKHKVNTSDFINIDEQKDAAAAVKKWGYPIVFKKRRFGYDGYGTFIVRSQRDLSTFNKNHLANSSVGFIAEPFIKFQRELAVTFARNTHGEIIQLPIVETQQQNSICRWVSGPISCTRATSVLKFIKKFITKTNYVGIIAFELFDTGKDILVNEVAPRVHNSSHYSMDALSCDQFEYHIRAICGQSLPQIKLHAPAFAMVNLLGKKSNIPKWQLSHTANMHWYGKVQNRRGRKMGHINVLGKDRDKTLKNALIIAKEIKL